MIKRVNSRLVGSNKHVILVHKLHSDLTKIKVVYTIEGTKKKIELDFNPDIPTQVDAILVALV